MSASTDETGLKTRERNDQVLEFVPDTVYRISKHYVKAGQRMPTLLVKLYTYQMCRALAYIHSMGVCHRDIKPQVGGVDWLGACVRALVCGGWDGDGRGGS